VSHAIRERRRLDRVVVGAAALGAAVALLSGGGCRRRHATGSIPHFVDVSTPSGIARTGPTYDAAIGDFDDDGHPDIYIGGHGSGAVLLRNLGDGRFENVIERSGIDPMGDQHGTAWTDLDNDGRLDLVVGLGAGRGLVEKQNRLYRDDGDGRFHDVAVASGTADPHGRARAVAALDVDGDGRLDLVVANVASPSRLFHNRGDGTFEDVSEQSGIAAISATRLAWADVDHDGDPDLLFSGTPRGLRLLRNDGGLRFTDVTEESGAARDRRSYAGMAFGDYDGDGVLDLYMSSGSDFSDVVRAPAEDRVTFAFFAHETPSGVDFDASDPAAAGVEVELYENGWPAPAELIACGGRRPTTARFTCAAADAVADAMPAGGDGYVLWRDRAPSTPCDGCPPRSRWHLRWRGAGDHHQTGIVYGAARPEGIGFAPAVAGGGALFRGLGDGRFARVDPPGLMHEANGQAVQWADVDDDGWLDLYVVDSGVDGEGGRNVLLMNDGHGGFTRASAASGASPSSGAGRGSGAHFVDVDGDGRLDLLLTNGWGAPPFDRGPAYLLHNESPPAHWLEVHLEGVRSNRLGLGAWLELDACGVRQVRYHDGMTSYFSQSVVDPHFGLGRCDHADSLTIEWPSGARDLVRNVAVDRILRVREGGR
jgi:hypothetical protein